MIAQIIAFAADMSDMSDKIKALHKDCYFVTLDRERKDKLIRKTSEEMKLEKKEKKLEAIVAKLK